MKSLLIAFCMLISVPGYARAESQFNIPDPFVGMETFQSADELLQRAPDATECATRVFADALAETAPQIPEDADESVINAWVQETFARGDVLDNVLLCPEIAAAADDDAIKFMPIKHTFPNGREIVVNYETQPKILKHRQLIARKRGMPGDDNPNPRIGALDDPTIWVNTDPAWYAIMVVEHGTLDNFVGPGKNNTISAKWIEDNIDSIYPNGLLTCTNRSGIARNSAEINLAVTRTIGMDDDPNDYYVAGDVNLQWISYTEIGLDIILTVATYGGFAAVKGVTVAARASRVAKQLTTSVRALTKIDAVRDYIRLAQKASKIGDQIKLLTNVTKTKSMQILKKIAKLDNLDDAKSVAKTLGNMQRNKRISNVDNIADARKEIQNLLKSQNNKINAYKKNLENGAKGWRPDELKKAIKTAEEQLREYEKMSSMLGQVDNIDELKDLLSYGDKLNSIDNVKDLEKLGDLNRSGKRAAKQANADQVKELEKQRDEIEKLMKKMASENKDVARYIDESKSLADINDARRALKGIKFKNRGNVLARGWRAWRAIGKTGGKVDAGRKLVAKHSKLSARIRDRLFNETVKFGGGLAKVASQGGLIYGVVRFAGDMYDYTETSTGEFTNNIEFKPLGLLSADDLPGQENKVNYGMWMMWMGDGVDPAADDAAYLQAMDFAQKFHQDLIEVQSDNNTNYCNVDIYVVRPVLRNPDAPDAGIYYLVMNDEPWTTATQ